MEGKKSFLLYCDQIGLFKKLPDEQAGKLIKIIFEYVNDLNPEINDVLLDVAFDPIKLQLKRDLMNWNNIVERNRINGSKGGRPKNPTQPKEPTGLIGKPKEPKKADSDTDNDTVTDNDSETQNLKAEQARPTYDNFLKFFNEKMNRKFKGCDKSKRQFAARVKQGYGAKDFVKAIEALKNDQYHIDTSFKHVTPEFITRPDKLEKFINQVNSNPSRYNVGNLDYDEKWSMKTE